MVHVTQKVRRQNLDFIKKLIAQTMPYGALDNYLRAVLSTTYGFHPRTIEQYLTDLANSGIIEWDAEAARWKTTETK